jgi:hypothetical protein
LHKKEKGFILGVIFTYAFFMSADIRLKKVMEH